MLFSHKTQIENCQFVQPVVALVFLSENGVVQCKVCSDKIVYHILFSLISSGLGLPFSLGPYELFDVNIKPQLPWVISVLIRFNQFI